MRGLRHEDDVRGLYNPRHEHDACGLGFVAELQPPRLRTTSEQGARGPAPPRATAAPPACDPEHRRRRGHPPPDPARFFERVLSQREGIELPLAGDYGVAQCFLSRDPARCDAQMGCSRTSSATTTRRCIGWRDVPVDAGVLGPDRAQRGR